MKTEYFSPLRSYYTKKTVPAVNLITVQGLFHQTNLRVNWELSKKIVYSLISISDIFFTPLADVHFLLHYWKEYDAKLNEHPPAHRTVHFYFLFVE